MHSPNPAERQGISRTDGPRIGDEWLPRSLASAVRSALRQFPVVLVTGARRCGKTTLVGELEPERAYLDLDEERLRRLAIEDPDGFVADLPDEVAIDEVQRAPALLSAIKVSVDRDRRPGRFLLIGSRDLLLLPSVTDSLAGRIAVLELQPLTESEKERGRGGFLRALLDQEFPARVADDGPPNGGRDAARRILAGGYPDAFRRTAAEARQWRRNYLLAIMAKDARDAARIRDASELERLVELLAAFTAQPLNVSRLSRDLGLDRETVNRYLAVLERLFLIRRLPSWHHAAARRPARSPKIHVRDTGLAATLADVGEEDWMTRRESFGPLLESFVVQQIAAQAGWTDPDLRLWHYRGPGRGRGGSPAHPPPEDLGHRGEGRGNRPPPGRRRPPHPRRPLRQRLRRRLRPPHRPPHPPPPRPPPPGRLPPRTLAPITGPTYGTSRAPSAPAAGPRPSATGETPDTPHSLRSQAKVPAPLPVEPPLDRPERGCSRPVAAPPRLSALTTSPRGGRFDRSKQPT